MNLYLEVQFLEHVLFSILWFSILLQTRIFKASVFVLNIPLSHESNRTSALDLTELLVVMSFSEDFPSLTSKGMLIFLTSAFPSKYQTYGLQEIWTTNKIMGSSWALRMDVSKTLQ